MSGAIVPILAAIAARRQQEEEERMAQYSSSDLDGWEFKIVRSSLGRFSSQTVINDLCRREAAAGWEMVEKFDDHRIRFKRRVERRSQDTALGLDSYRTGLGTKSSSAAMMVAGILFVLIGLAAFYLLSLR